MLEKQELKEKIIEPLFTKSTILFLIIVFIVFSIPLIYRKFWYLLN